MQTVASRLLIINAGRLAADGPVDDLMSRASGNVHLSVEAAGSSVAEQLTALPGVSAVVPLGERDGRIRVRLTASAATDLRPEIFRMAGLSGWTLYELHQEAGSLEDLFRELTAKGEAS